MIGPFALMYDLTVRHKELTKSIVGFETFGHQDFISISDTMISVWSNSGSIPFMFKNIDFDSSCSKKFLT